MGWHVSKPPEASAPKPLPTEPPRDWCMANRGRKCRFGTAGECLDCGRHRTGAPALGLILTSSKAERLNLEV